jgi:hypothetical protein
MELEQIWTLIIAAAPALTSIIGVIFAVAKGIKEFRKVDGSLISLKQANAAIIKENQELKKEMKKVYKLHSEIVEHIHYKEQDDGAQQN